MAAGITACGDKARIVAGWEPQAWADACVAYGWARPDLFAHYRTTGRSYVHVDLGWWNRKPARDVLEGAHKVMVNCREPASTGAYLRNRPTMTRFDRSGISVSPWQPVGQGRHVLVAGMSAKCAETYDLKPEAWERRAIEAIHAVRWTNGDSPARSIVYRPKPSWPGYSILPGATLSPPTEALADVLRHCWAVVTHHSNVAVDALIAGVPVCVEQGVCSPFSTPVARLWDPRRIDGRLDMLGALAWMQWTPAEMRNGACWDHLKRETSLCG